MNAVLQEAHPSVKKSVYLYVLINDRMAFKEKDVLKALSKVQDPDLHQDLVTLGMIKDIALSEGRVGFTVVLTTPACPLKEKIKQDCIEAIQSTLSDEIEIDVNITAEVTTNPNDLSGKIPNIKNIIAISSGKGGVGKSTVTSNLAVALSKTGAKVGVIDADIFGPSVPTMFGVENAQPGIVEEDGKNMVIPIKSKGVKLISIGFLSPNDQAIVWRGPMASSALRQFIGDVQWGALDYLLIDLPPGTSDIHLTLVQAIGLTGAIVVTTPQKVALADTQKGLAMFQQTQIAVPILGVIENMAYFSPEELPNNKYYIFGKDGGKKFAEKHKVPLLAEIPIVQSIREGGDIGIPVAMEDSITSKAFEKLAQKVAQQIAIKNSTKEASTPVEIS
jgi:ATP-binding protein involved in chromosome partitioning